MVLVVQGFNYVLKSKVKGGFIMEITETIEIGLAYECKAIGIKNEVVGVVEQLYNNTVLINVVRCAPSDRATVIELQNRLLVKYEDVHACIEVECTA